MKPSLIIYIYFILSLLYFSQAFIFGEESSSIGQPILIVVMLINIFYFIKCFSIKDKPLLFYALTLFILMNLVYYIWGDVFIENVTTRKSFQIFKSILLANTSFFPAFYWSRRRFKLNTIVLILACLYFFAILIGNQKTINEHEQNLVENFTNNFGYYFLNFIPFIFLIRGVPYLKIIVLLILNLLIIESAKRGAIVTMIAADIVFVIYLYKIRISSGLISKLAILSIVFTSAYYAYARFQQNEFVRYRFEQLQEGESSGRDRMYASLMLNWEENYDFVQKLFGGGFCKSARINNGVFAHNDWLELLTDLGIAGIIVYAVIIYSMYRSIADVKGQTYKFILLSVSVIWTVKTFFSMSYLDENSFILMLLIGIIIGNSKSYERKKIEVVQRA